VTLSVKVRWYASSEGRKEEGECRRKRVMVCRICDVSSKLSLCIQPRSSALAAAISGRRQLVYDIARGLSGTKHMLCHLDFCS
jgi:hypothetical protein